MVLEHIAKSKPWVGLKNNKKNPGNLIQKIVENWKILKAPQFTLSLPKEQDSERDANGVFHFLSHVSVELELSPGL